KRLVRPERDGSRVPAESDAVLPLEPLDEGRGVDEVVSLREPFERPQDEQASSHPKDVPTASKGVQDLGNSVGAVIEAGGDLADRGAHRAGLAQDVADGPGEVGSLRCRHAKRRADRGNNRTTGVRPPSCETARPGGGDGWAT